MEKISNYKIITTKPTIKVGSIEKGACFERLSLITIFPKLPLAENKMKHPVKTYKQINEKPLKRKVIS